MMENRNKFWLYIGLMGGSAALSLVGSLIGKTVIGYILFGIGLAGALAMFFLSLRKGFFSGYWRPLVLGLVLGLLLTSSAVIFIQRGFRITPLNSSSMTGLYRSALGSSGAGGQGFQGGGSFSGNGTFQGGGSFGGNDTFQGRGANGGFTQGGTSSNNFSGRSSSSSGSSSSTTAANTTAIRAMAMRNLFISLLGWLFFAAGVILLAIALYKFLKKKTDYSGQRWKMLLLGFVAAGLISASTTHMLLPTPRVRTGTYASQAYGQRRVGSGTAASGTFVPGQLPGSTATVAATTKDSPTTTETVSPLSIAETAIVTATPAAAVVSETPQPTATTDSVSDYSLVVCLNVDYRVGLNVRDFPSNDGKLIGSIPIAGCFTLNGRSSAYPGWYRLATGQNGMGGIQIYAADTETNLWVYSNTYTDATAANLERLPDITVTVQK